MNLTTDSVKVVLQMFCIKDKINHINDYSEFHEA